MVIRNCQLFTKSVRWKEKLNTEIMNWDLICKNPFYCTHSNQFTVFQCTIYAYKQPSIWSTEWKVLRNANSSGLKRNISSNGRTSQTNLTVCFYSLRLKIINGVEFTCSTAKQEHSNLSISNSTSDVFHVLFQFDNNLTWGLSHFHSSLAVSYNNILGIKPHIPSIQI
jgi:hypothetical protein